MSWSQDFCLACDRQTDDSLYCGEACRLAEYEKANSVSESSSPTTQRLSSNNFYLPPAYDFAAYRTSSSSSSRPQTAPVVLPAKPVLTPSSSQSSLVSMKSFSSTTSTESTTHVSEAARLQLRAYASAFDQSRNSRRQSQ